MLEIKKVFTINEYEPWSGAVDTYNKICDAGKLDELEFLLEDLYPDGIEETQLNDILWFDDEWVLECLGINEDEDEDEDEF